MSKRARRIKNTAAVRLCAAALAALLLAPPAACGLGVVFGAGAGLSAGVVFGDVVTCGAAAARAAAATAAQ